MQAVDDTEGPCYKCGESGHRAAACRQDVGRCTACNKKGHKEAVCWRAHPEFKPDWMTGSSGAEGPESQTEGGQAGRAVGAAGPTAGCLRRKARAQRERAAGHFGGARRG
jgi:hypothetical protein